MVNCFTLVELSLLLYWIVIHIFIIGFPLVFLVVNKLNGKGVLVDPYALIGLYVVLKLFGGGNIMLMLKCWKILFSNVVSLS